MTELVKHLVSGLVSVPGGVSINTVEGEASLLVELTVDPADVAAIHGPDGETLRSLRTVLSAASGQRRAVLELVEPGNGMAAAPAESSADESTSDDDTAE